MAKTKPQADEPRETQGATSTAKKAKRPSKKQPTKKTAKKPVKKMRVAKKQATKKPAKKSVKKVVAPVQKAKKPAKKAERPAEQEERTVISSPPSRQRRETERPKQLLPKSKKLEKQHLRMHKPKKCNGGVEQGERHQLAGKTASV